MVFTFCSNFEPVSYSEYFFAYVDAILCPLISISSNLKEDLVLLSASQYGLLTLHAVDLTYICSCTNNFEFSALPIICT